MNSVDEIGLTGIIEQSDTLIGYISGENGIQGIITGSMSVSGSLAVSTVIDSSSNTFVIVDENGNEIPAILVEDEVTVSATPNDIRLGVTAITQDGLITGEKVIPSYHTSEGYRVVTKGSRFIIPHSDYDYEKLQVVICKFNTSVANSVDTIKVALEDKVYNVNSITALASVVKDDANAHIDLGITNDTGSICVIRYFMYKEIY